MSEPYYILNRDWLVTLCVGVVMSLPVVAVASQPMLLSNQPQTHRIRPFEIDLYGGINASNQTNSTFVTVNSKPIRINQYNVDGQTRWSGVIGLGVSKLFRMNRVSLNVGPSIYCADLSNTRGIDTPDVNEFPSADTLTYRFNAASAALMLEGHITYTKHNWQPFIVGGVGASWNHLYHFSEFPTDPNGTAEALPPFQNARPVSFAYNVGVGLQGLIGKDSRHNVNYIASIGYRYFNFGPGELGLFAGQTSTAHLKVPTLSSSAILGSLGAVFY